MRRLPRALLPCALIAGLLLPAAPAAAHRGDFDIQGHRGGLGLTVESTIASFSHGLELGVSTLELDVQITQDGYAVVTHDRKVDGKKCRDTAPYTPDDPEYPYVGRFINTLSLKQVKQLDCGSLPQANFPQQQPDPGARMPELRDIFALVHRFRAYGVKLNVETKVEAGAPAETAPRCGDSRAGSGGFPSCPSRTRRREAATSRRNSSGSSGTARPSCRSTHDASCGIDEYSVTKTPSSSRPVAPYVR